MLFLSLKITSLTSFSLSGFAFLGLSAKQKTSFPQKAGALNAKTGPEACYHALIALGTPSPEAITNISSQQVS